MTSAVGAGAELIVPPCPLCQFNLEKSQPKVAEAGSGYSPVPVIYFTQALGLALGQDIATLGFEKNSSDIMPLLKKKGIA
jgi:heterodisulfide reductase subunit B